MAAVAFALHDSCDLKPGVTSQGMCGWPEKLDQDARRTDFTVSRRWTSRISRTRPCGPQAKATSRFQKKWFRSVKIVSLGQFEVATPYIFAQCFIASQRNAKKLNQHSNRAFCG